jgi:glycine betaine transporter
MNIKLLGKTDGKVFFSTLIVSVVAVLFGVLNPEKFATALSTMQSWISRNFGWWYLLVVAGIVAFLMWAAFGKYGRIKLGKDDDEPEYSTFSWIAMLFSCGIGIGFIFWAIAEPLYHYMQTPYLAQPQTPEAAKVGMQIAIFHWGIHGWACYCIAGLAIGYYTYRMGKPLTVANSLSGVMKNTEGFWGKLVDFLAAFATIAGISTSLGMGLMSISYGIKHLFGASLGTAGLVIIMLALICGYTLSAVSGIGRGIKYLSNINVWLAFVVMLFFLFVGPTRYLLNSMVDSVGTYFQKLIFMTFWADSMETASKGKWLGWWTIFYWAWWIAWGPFVGGFVARISKGRTIREYIIGVIFVPLVITFIWFNITGGSAIYAEVHKTTEMWKAIQADMGSGIFVLLSTYPMGYLVSFVVFINLMFFLVTSADSSSFFVAMIMSEGELEPTIAMKLVWGFVIGLVSVILLVSGGLKALQTASIVAALPFSIVMVLMMVSTYKGLKKETFN